MYKQDQRDAYSTIDPDEYEHESQASEDWVSDNMSRVMLPRKTENIPQLENVSIATVISYLLQLIWFLFLSSSKGIGKRATSALKWIFDHLVPKSLSQRQNSMLKIEHLNKLRQKWRHVSKLPAFAAQQESLELLQEIGHDSTEEHNNFLHPDQASVKTVVRLMLDQRNRPHIQCTLENVPVSFLVDTGASLSILSYDTYLKIPNHNSLPRTYETPKLYDHQRHEIKVMFGVMCRATFGDKTLLIPLLVSPASKSNVLGVDVLIGRSLVLTHRGTDAYLIVGECTAEKRPVMKLSDGMPMYILEDSVVPSESVRSITVTPCVYPMFVDIPESYLEITYISPSEGFEGRTKFIKLDDEGKAKLKVCNASLIDLVLLANQVIGTAKFAPDYSPPFAKRLKHKPSKTSISTSGEPETKLEGSASPPNLENDISFKQEKIEQVFVDQTSPSETPASASIKKELTQNHPVVEKVDCFCSIPQDTIVIRGNRYGDTNCPYLTAGSYTRTPLASGVIEKFKLGNKQICIIYGSTKKDIKTALDNVPQGNNVAIITNKDCFDVDQNRRLVALTGNCKQHPFLYHLEPTFISFNRTVRGKHTKMVHQLCDRIWFEVLNIKVEMYYGPLAPKQVHYVLHIPDILMMKEDWIHNLVGALVKPFSTTVRILEPYLFPDSNNHQTTMFNGILQKVTKLHGITLQGRMPHMEKTYSASEDYIKNCACDYCVKARDQETYKDMKGIVEEADQDLR